MAAACRCIHRRSPSRTPFSCAILSYVEVNAATSAQLARGSQSARPPCLRIRTEVVMEIRSRNSSHASLQCRPSKTLLYSRLVIVA